MKTFLNTYMESKLDISTEELDQLKSKFTDTVDKVYLVFGANAFRRIGSDGTVDNRLNRALMDAIMIGLERISKEKATANKDRILALNRSLPQSDTDFTESLIYGTSDTKRLQYRIAQWLRELKTKIGS